MRRRLVAMGVIAATFAFATAMYVLSQHQLAPPHRWNVLLVTLDTTRADRLGCYGYRHAETPTIDALSRGGIRYNRCYSPVPLTLPAHCSLMTGLLPPRHGIRVNGQDTLASEAETLAEILRRNGYATGAVVGAFVLDSQFGLDQGFDHYDDDMSSGTKGNRFSFAERNAQHVTEAALTWWNATRHEPKFLWVHYFDPHSPYAPPGYDPTFANRSAYDAEINFVDTELNRLLEAVGKDKQRRTLIVLTADHGEGLGEHGEETHGLFTYDTTLRVPLVVCFPDGNHAGTVISAPVSLVDVLPSVLTWLDLSGSTVPDGRLLPLENDGLTIADAEKLPVYFESLYAEFAYGWSPLVGIVEGDYKFIQAPRPELYMLNDDPAEERNGYVASEAIAQRMTLRLSRTIEQIAQRGSLESTTIRMTDEDWSKLHALGYVAANRKLDNPERNISVVGSDPKDMLEIYNRIQYATACLDSKRVTQAVELLIRVLTSDDPTNKRVVRLLATLVSEDPELRPRIVDCLQCYARATDQEEIDTFALGKLGIALIEEQRHTEAIEVLTRLSKSQPRNAAAFYYLGSAYRRIGKPVEAIQSFQKAIELVESVGKSSTWLDDARQLIEVLQKHVMDQHDGQ